jgi:hypothetical protein
MQRAATLEIQADGPISEVLEDPDGGSCAEVASGRNLN